ncbi:MAG: AgmX/PglI C-terminal domain-containing protein [Polyangiales bacterium]
MADSFLRPPPVKDNGRKIHSSCFAADRRLVGGWYFAREDLSKNAQAAVVPRTAPPTPSYEPEFDLPDEELVEEEQAPEEPRRTVVREQCNGSLTKAEIQETIDSVARKQVQACYERELKSNNTLEGTMNVLITIATNGAVSGVRTGGSLKSGSVSSCIKSVARKWKFEQPTGGCVQTVVPFSFSPKS